MQTMQIENANLILFDSDDYTSTLILDVLARMALTSVRHVRSALNLPETIQSACPDLVIFNYHSEHPDSVIICNTIRLICPEAAIIAIASPGPALKSVRKVASSTGCIDEILEKPLSEELMCLAVKDLLKNKLLKKELESRTEKLEMMLPEAVLNVVNHASANEAEMFEAAVLFSDIRGSSRLIQEMPARDFFKLLNEFLSEQSRLIKQYEGSVIKYTGDGVMAIFRGMGRSYLALRCGLELVESSKSSNLDCGVGISEGLVLAGLIGDAHQSGQRRQYDVIGANVHLASRLCTMANAGEVIATKRINQAARVNTPEPRDIGSINVRGFDADIECIAFDINHNTRSIHP